MDDDDSNYKDKNEDTDEDDGFEMIATVVVKRTETKIMTILMTKTTVKCQETAIMMAMAMM